MMVTWAQITFTLRKPKSPKEDLQTEILFFSAIIIVILALTVKYAAFYARRDPVPMIVWGWYLAAVASANSSDKVARSLAIASSVIILLVSAGVMLWLFKLLWPQVKSRQLTIFEFEEKTGQKKNRALRNRIQHDCNQDNVALEYKQ
ncbi:hypothetical protein H4219_005162 [Mycoemilia scoparia]|uniref:Uncharacterized protein n=1 Tax=Mycoemilia scoparia TaxID=417184 RepID=A0A9W7ZP30_9FUNG|nr:hypothetical protein H4219_005162 [Mycoemilia scoparia]